MRTTLACPTFVASKGAHDTCVRCGWPVASHRASKAPASMKTSKIWADTIRQDVCKSSSCRRVIYFAQVIKTGNVMPFDRRPVPIAAQVEIGTGREEWTVDLAHSHFATCPAAPQFRHARGRR